MCTREGRFLKPRRGIGCSNEKTSLYADARLFWQTALGEVFAENVSVSWYASEN